ncbi:MAG TPA: hypothetical protein VFC19_27290 [Candidatus Limnocylindrales bacterium]|nr:hypothetical protein [Candidatus Limnocylindrales bacterium]
MPDSIAHPATGPARIALVGDRSPHVMAHNRIPVALAHATLDPEAIDPYWIASGEVAGVADLAGFDGIWVVPGSPYADRDGVLSAIRSARTGGVPLLGTCGGFQHMVLEYARNVLGLDVDHAEDPTGAAAGPIIVPLACSLLGQESEVDVLPATRACDILGAGQRIERFFCSYGLHEHYRDALVEAGLVFCATDTTGAARMLEIPNHPFYIGALYQPELSSDSSWVHPLIRAFATAALQHASKHSIAA